VPTITPTPAPQSLADAPDLPTWIEEYVHAYGGKVTVNGAEMDADQLTAAIRHNPVTFTQTKLVNGAEISFVIVNDIPLAYREKTGTWQEATMAKLGEWNGLEFECSLRLDDRKYQEFANISKKALGKNSVVVLTSNLDVTRVFGDFTQADWQKVLDNWGNIQQNFSSGIVPAGYPYYWQWGLDAMDSYVTNAFGGNPQYRSQQLYESGLRSDGTRIEALKQFQAQASHEDMLKIFEFVVRTRVLQFPQIKRWDVSDEVSASYVMYRDNHTMDVHFWENATGLTPAELTIKVAQWVKEDSPEAKTYITESDIFDTGNPVASAEIDYFYNTYIPEINKLNSDHSVDGVIGENNWWIYEPQNWSVISDRIDSLMAKGLEIGGAETMIVSGDTPINDCCGRYKLVQIQDPVLSQAEMYAQWLDLYLNKGIKNIGFGNIDDFYAWTQDVGLPDANPTLFDIDYRAKPAYYEMIKVLFKHLS
jgi:GH35 family endo-1,4-beta-xylanase